MRVVMFYHSLLSDWNHGNAHFLRGVVSEMISRGINVDVYEPRDSWSLQNLIKDHGRDAIADFYESYPGLQTNQYDPGSLDLDAVLDGADLVIVHEWNDHKLVAHVGEHRAGRPHYRLFFHDTHHRAVTDPKSMSKYDLAHYDGVLVFGKTIGEIYVKKGWARNVWTWHEAADTRVFFPRTRDDASPYFDLIWIGNWGDGERTKELREYLIEPARELGLRARVHGVRYPSAAKSALKKAGIDYAGWLPNFLVPRAFANAKMTVHIPRLPYVRKLPGIPTIRPFEALACGLPLVSAFWNDSENLFTAGEDFLFARSGDEMKSRLKQLLEDPDLRRSLADHGLRTIRTRHTCAHRVDELLAIYAEIETPQRRMVA